MMALSNIRDILTSFSPALDYLAISAGDGRIKIWDTLKGQVQTEFADITSTEATNIYTKAQKGHLSVDYTCMQWLSLDRKKKRKLESSFLVLGTGGGDVLALDVAAGQLKWRVTDCHPGGVSSVSFSISGSCIYSAGADGMICKIEPHTGNLLGKFRASTKAISCISVSSDGKMLATAAAQLKTFNCSDHKKIQKFSGHPAAVRCMIFSEDGKYILSSAAGERYVAVWRTDAGKRQSASCVLAMEHPAVFIDSRCIDNGKVEVAGLYVLAISENGVCYFWYGQNIKELRSSKPTKVSLSVEDIKSHKRALPAIFAAKLQGVAQPTSVHAFVASGLLVKPMFQKLIVHSGTDLVLNSSQGGVLLPLGQSVIKSKKGLDVQNKVTALDRAHAEDAILPIPKIADFNEKKDRHQNLSTDPDEMVDDLVDCQGEATSAKVEDDVMENEADSETFCMEDRLRSLGIIGCKDDLMLKTPFDSTMIEGIDVEANMPQRKIRSAISSMAPDDAYKSLEALVALWQSRSHSRQHILPWIHSILVTHSHYIMSQEPKNHHMLYFLLKIAKSRGVAVQHLLQLSGRLQLVTAQIDKAVPTRTQIPTHDHQLDGSEDEDEDVDDLLYGEEDSESEISSDDDS